MEKNNAILFLVVGILVGAAVGIAAGYVIGNSSSNETYWYYIDYGDYATSATENGWISAESDTVINGLFKALDKKGVEYEITDTGWITSINGVYPVWDASTSDSWGSWIWTINGYTAYGAWAKNSGFDVTLGTIFFIGVTGYDKDYNPTLDPNDEAGWKTGGPFKA
ncbi:MAG: hypothetical protein FWC29_01070 [Methanomassiliicoccaceae archaeon]|nr:hypothetical protein [Methanomassiliicoccaceae archaeon]